MCFTRIHNECWKQFNILRCLNLIVCIHPHSCKIVWGNIGFSFKTANKTIIKYFVENPIFQRLGNALSMLLLLLLMHLKSAFLEIEITRRFLLANEQWHVFSYACSKLLKLHKYKYAKCDGINKIDTNMALICWGKNMLIHASWHRSASYRTHPIIVDNRVFFFVRSWYRQFHLRHRQYDTL